MNLKTLKKVDWETYSKDPKSILNNPNLVVRDGDKYFNWATVSAIACAKIFFNERLPRAEVEKLKPSRRTSKSWFFFGSRSKPKEGTTPPQARVTYFFLLEFRL